MTDKKEPPIWLGRDAFAAAVEKAMIAARRPADSEGNRVFVKLRPRIFAEEMREMFRRAMDRDVQIREWDSLVAPPALPPDLQEFFK